MPGRLVYFWLFLAYKAGIIDIDDHFLYNNRM